jgi:hypothetical protein
MEEQPEETNYWYWGLMVGLGMLIGVVLWNKPRGDNQPFVVTPGGVSTSKPSTSTPEAAPPEIGEATSTQPAIVVGTLQVSDNPERGNFMVLAGPDGKRLRTVYVKTQRDFSPLLGLNVSVRFEGTQDNFHLVDITENK